MKKILFYNDFHNGDIHMSREYVKDLISLLGNNHYFYYHKNNPNILKDINELTYVSNDDDSYDLKINTWIGQYINIDNMFLGCNFPNYYNIMKRVYRTLNLHNHIKDIKYYIPSINYDYYRIDSFKSDRLKKRKNILFCNNSVDSGQSINFDFSNIINKLGNHYNDINFIITNHNDNIKITDNVFFSKEIINGDNNFDLNEISYISTYCDIIIGRSSGPYVFSITKENILQKHKKFISFTNDISSSWFLDGVVDLVWNNNYSEENIINIIKTEINKL